MKKHLFNSIVRVPVSYTGRKLMRLGGRLTGIGASLILKVGDL
jgi:hypothetical protein